MRPLRATRLAVHASSPVCCPAGYLSLLIPNGNSSHTNQVERTLTMLDSLERSRAFITDKLGWLPENVLGAALLILAILVALALHGTVRRLIARLMRDRPSYSLSLFTSAEGATRLALIILAATLVLPVLPLTLEAPSIVPRLL